jgi:hypothetical protein
LPGRTWLRLGLVLLALLQGVPALWAAVWPRSFYAGFPTRGRAWLTLFPPANDHLVRDFGLMALQLTAALVCAAIRAEFRFVRAILLAALVFYVPHLVYHQLHLVAGSDLPAQLVSQVTPLVLVALLLVVNRLTRPPEREPGRPG